jgi:hypothetical protein
MQCDDAQSDTNAQGMTPQQSLRVDFVLQNASSIGSDGEMMGLETDTKQNQVINMSQMQESL